MNGAGEKTIREAVDSSLSDAARQTIDGDSLRDIREGIRAADEEFLWAKGIIPKTFQQLLEEEAARAEEAGNERRGEGGVGEGAEEGDGETSSQEQVAPTIQDYFPIPTSVDILNKTASTTDEY